jgi:hypothetical protein
VPAVAAAVLVALAGTACDSTMPANVFLPTYTLQSGGPGQSQPPVTLPTGLLEGILVEEDGCLWVEADPFRSLVLWPTDSSAVIDDSDRVVVRNGGHEAIVGTAITAGGGEYTDEHYAFVVEILGEALPSACRASGLYWIGYEIQSVTE